MSHYRRFTRESKTCSRLVPTLSFAVWFALAGGAIAQSTEEDHAVTLSAAGGLTTIVGRDAGKLDHGGNFQLGAGHFFNDYFAITGTFSFNGLGITRNQLDLLNQPDGSARVYSLTVDPMIRLPLGRRWSVYAVGGGGYLRRTIEFTQPTVAQTFVIDPWWGYIGPALVPVNQVLGSVTSNAGALDIGGGLNVPLPNSSMRLFVESRYLHGFTGHSGTSVVPIVFGIRW